MTEIPKKKMQRVGHVVAKVAALLSERPELGRNELARLTGASPNTVTKALRQAREGILEAREIMRTRWLEEADKRMPPEKVVHGLANIAEAPETQDAVRLAAYSHFSKAYGVNDPPPAEAAEAPDPRPMFVLEGQTTINLIAPRRPDDDD